MLSQQKWGHIDCTKSHYPLVHVDTMLGASENVLFPGHNHLLTTDTDDPTLIITLAGDRAIVKVSGHPYRWLAGGYDLEIGHFHKWLTCWATWWIVAFLPSVCTS